MSRFGLGLLVLGAVGAGEGGFGGFGGIFRLAGLGGSLGVDVELDDQVEQDRDGLAIFDGRFKTGFADGVYGALVEPEADGPCDDDLCRFSVRADHGVIDGHAINGIRLRVLV